MDIESIIESVNELTLNTMTVTRIFDMLYEVEEDEDNQKVEHLIEAIKQKIFQLAEHGGFNQIEDKTAIFYKMFIVPLMEME
jgi:hypothetical protein